MTTDLPALAPRPRSVTLRVAYTIVLVVLLAGLPWLATATLGRIGGWPSGDSLLSVVVLFAAGAVVATQVSYRWFDALLLLIPFVGLVFLVKFAWRLALLPYRDWPPRPAEAGRWRKVAHPSRPGAGLYLVDPDRRG